MQLKDSAYSGVLYIILLWWDFSCIIAADIRTASPESTVFYVGIQFLKADVLLFISAAVYNIHIHSCLSEEASIFKVCIEVGRRDWLRMLLMDSFLD